MAAGDHRAAAELLRGLALRAPRNVPAAAFLQEVELRLRAAGADETASERDLQLSLAREWREWALRAPSAARLVLAARLEVDRVAALRLLEQALELDPRCAWAHYGMAHLRAAAGDWNAARPSLEMALEIEPGHVAARRLEAAAMARGGRPVLAAGALRRWLDNSRDDPRVDPRVRVGAQLDLAHILVELGHPEEALSTLDRIQDRTLREAEGLAILAATLQALDEPWDAMRAAQEAERLAPGDPLPLIQQAVLYEEWLGDPDAAREAWERVLAEAEGRADLGGLFLRLRARIAIERHEERAAREGRGGGRP